MILNFEMAEKKERKRSTPFTLSEKMNLLELVQNHYTIIENKKTDGATNKEKNRHWDDIQKEFSADNVGVYRDVQCLKNLWENLKRAGKAVLNTERQNQFKTGKYYGIA